jgi:superfamily II DNA helicase RecQ
MSVDEAHVIASAGLTGDNGEAPWRPTYGNLDSFRLLLPTTASVSALTATANSYVDSVITKKLNLRPNTVNISGSLNRPNITYATLDIVDNLSNFNNLNFLVPATFHPPMLLQPTLVFFDSQSMARDVARHLNSTFTLDQQRLRIGYV